MEDAATVEISTRASSWQWIRHGAKTTTGIEITRELVTQMLTTVTVRAIADGSGADDWVVEIARDIVAHGCMGDDFPAFLTTYGYINYLVGCG